MHINKKIKFFIPFLVTIASLVFFLLPTFVLATNDCNQYCQQNGLSNVSDSILNRCVGNINNSMLDGADGAAYETQLNYLSSRGKKCYSFKNTDENCPSYTNNSITGNCICAQKTSDNCESCNVKTGECKTGDRCKSQFGGTCKDPVFVGRTQNHNYCPDENMDDLKENVDCPQGTVCCAPKSANNPTPLATTTAPTIAPTTAPTMPPATAPTAPTTPTTPTSPSTIVSNPDSIVPCGKSGGAPCTICHLIVGISRLVAWGKNILIILAITGIVISGILYMISSGSESMMTKSKDALKASVVGFAIVISAWLMINTVIWLLAIKTDLGVQVTSWNSFTCDTTSSALTGGSGSSTPTTDALAEKDKAECNKYCTDLGGSETIVNKCVSDCVAKKSEDRKKGSAATGMLSNSEAIEKLKQAGINTTSSTGCVGQDKIGCTTLENMPASAVDNLIALKGACPGISTVTGGTESAGHVSHGSGKPIFDIQADSGLAQCVANNKGNFNITQLCTDGSVANYNCGNYREKGGVLHIKF